jgi:hypothetical protein
MAHSGRELFYRSGANEMVVASVTTNPTFAVEDQRVLFTADALEVGRLRRTYDVMPGDQWFVMIRRSNAGTAGAARELILVQNLHEELKAKMGN